MREIDKPEFLRDFRRLCHAFNRAVDADTVDVYWRATSDMAIEAFRGAVDTAIRSAHFMPAPAVLRDYAGANAPVYEHPEPVRKLGAGDPFGHLTGAELEDHVRKMRAGLEFYRREGMTELERRALQVLEKYAHVEADTGGWEA